MYNKVTILILNFLYREPFRNFSKPCLNWVVQGLYPTGQIDKRLFFGGEQNLLLIKNFGGDSIKSITLFLMDSICLIEDSIPGYLYLHPVLFADSQ